MRTTQNDLTQRIQQASLTRKQQVIADYLIKNQNRVCTLSCLAIAREIGVSDASVIRFARAIGYGGFSDLKAACYQRLTQEAAQTAVGELPPAARLDMQFEKYHDLDLFQELPRLLCGNVEQSIRQNRPEVYQRVVDAICSSRNIFIVGLRGGIGPAVNFGRFLSFLADNVRVITSGEGDAFAQLQSLSPGDMVLAISFARYYKVDSLIADLVKRKGATLCTVADSAKSPLAQRADTLLLVQTQHFGFSNSMVGTLSVLEYLLTLLSWKNPQKYHRRLAEREQIMDPFYSRE